MQTIGSAATAPHQGSSSVTPGPMAPSSSAVKVPVSEMSAEDWITRRETLSHYLAPYADIPGTDSTDPSVKEELEHRT